MSLKEDFNYVLSNYVDKEKQVDSSSSLYQLINQKLPQRLKIEVQKSEYKVYGSMGKGNKTKFPWIAILNKEITSSTQQGLYLVYLFKSDMTGFYLSLNQGITNFKQKFLSKSYVYARKVANYFQEEINDTDLFSKAPIDLVASKGSLGYGYEKTNILSKYYRKDQFTENELLDDLKQMLIIYEDIFNHMGNMTYNEVIEKVIYDQNIYIHGDEALQSINLVLKEESSYPRGIEKSLNLVEPFQEKSRRYQKLTTPVQSKIDYLKKAKEDAYTGLEGERLALNSEKNRLQAMGHSEYAEKVDWVSSVNDVAGYDIKSYDLINGEIEEIYIEVKTSTSKVDTDIFISRNELLTSNKISHQYYIFRIYDVLSINPKYYIAKGPIEENFYLEPVTFRATYKWKILHS